MSRRRAKPFLTPGGTLVLPQDGPRKYLYWLKGAQSLEMTLVELGADEKVWARYTSRPYLDCPEFDPPTDGD